MVRGLFYCMDIGRWIGIFFGGCGWGFIFWVVCDYVCFGGYVFVECLLDLFEFFWLFVFLLLFFFGLFNGKKCAYIIEVIIILFSKCNE